MNRRLLLQLGAGAGLFGIAACSPARRAAQPQARGYLIFSTNEISGDLSVIDGETRKVLRTVPLGKRPRGVRVSPDGGTLYIAMSGSPIGGPGVDESKLPPPDKSADGIGVFDIASLTLQRTIRGVSDPEQLAPTADGKLVLASQDTNKAVILDARTGGVVAQVDVGDEPEGVAVSPDGRFAYVTAESADMVDVIDLARDARLREVKVGSRPRSVLFSADGSRAYVTGEGDRSLTVLDGRDHAVVGRLVFPNPDYKPMGLAMSADGSRLYLTTGRGGDLASVKLPELTVDKTVKVGARPWGVAVSPDGRFIFTANGPSNDLSVVDVASFQMVQKIPVGTRPWGVAVASKPK